MRACPWCKNPIAMVDVLGVLLIYSSNGASRHSSEWSRHRSALGVEVVLQFWLVLFTQWSCGTNDSGWARGVPGGVMCRMARLETRGRGPGEMPGPAQRNLTPGQDSVHWVTNYLVSNILRGGQIVCPQVNNKHLGASSLHWGH